MTTRTFTYTPDEHDERDHVYIAAQKVVLPTHFDLRPNYVPDILDQGQHNTCVANEVSNVLRFCLRKEHNLDFQPSRCFIYFFARLLSGMDVHKDEGVSIRDGLKAVARYGAPKEELYDYTTAHITTQPPKSAMQAGKQHIQGFKYLRVNNSVDTIKHAIYGGFPVILGISVYESFESESALKTGNIPLPAENEQLLGGHCVAFYGYDDAKQHFIMMNSWGTQVGIQGWFTLPYSYLKYASDLWTVCYFK